MGAVRLQFPVEGVILLDGGVKLTDYVPRDGRKQVLKDWPQKSYDALLCDGV